MKNGDVIGRNDLREGCYLRDFGDRMWRVVELGDKAVIVVDRMAPARRWVLLLVDVKGAA
jgi:hypothetical protein